MASWTPRGADPITHHTLVDGVPQWMHRSLRNWFDSQFSYKTSSRPPETRKWIARMEQYDMAAHTSWAGDLVSYGASSIFDGLGDAALDIIDWLVYDNAESGREGHNERLEEILVAGGSLWTTGVRDGLAGLERRVPEGVQTAAEAAMAIPGNAGSLLSEAWHAAYGINPDPEKAYAKSIKAVEAAAIPVVSPNHTGATLGTVIGQVRADGNWRLDMTREHGAHTTQHVVLGMMQALWTGQNDRHAGQPGYTPSTPAEAEAAVMLAVPLVQWFASGAIAQR
jgi:hypothetical protein